MTQTKKPKVLFFFAGWCGPSAAFRIILERSLEDYKDQYMPLECIDTDNAPNGILGQWRVLGVPTAILIGRYGREVGRLTGYNLKDHTVNFLRKGVL
jgi:thioredoxin-like negative regulator of GroEL